MLLSPVKQSHLIKCGKGSAYVSLVGISIRGSLFGIHQTTLLRTWDSVSQSSADLKGKQFLQVTLFIN